jgi:hypothetical protein
VAKCDNRAWHLIALEVDQMQQIARVIKPACCTISTLIFHSIEGKWRRTVIPKYILIDHTALALMRHIGHPNAAYPEAILL